MLKVAPQLLVLDAPAPFEDPAAGDQQQTPPSAPPDIGSGLPRPMGLGSLLGTAFQPWSTGYLGGFNAGEG